MVPTGIEHKKMLELARDHHQVIIIDHHVSACRELIDLPHNITYVYDETKSGAVLTWQHFTDKPAPLFLLYLQDRDLWQWRIPFSREFSAALQCYPMDFATWGDFEPMSVDSNNGCFRLIREGELVLRYQEKLINKIAGRASIINIAGHMVPGVHANDLQSEIAAELLRRNKAAPFSCVYCATGDDHVKFSLRSTEDRNFDVAKLAAAFSGGGHKLAAGFHVYAPPDTFEYLRELHLTTV